MIPGGFVQISLMILYRKSPRSGTPGASLLFFSGVFAAESESSAGAILTVQEMPK